MTTNTYSPEEAVLLFHRQDIAPLSIVMYHRNCTDAKLAELIDCMLARPDVVTQVHLSSNHLTDETGVKLACVVAASSTIRHLILRKNQLGAATYLAMAAALRVNTSLQFLDLSNNQKVEESLVDSAFVETLRLNSNRPTDSAWCLYSFSFKKVDFQRLQLEAKQLGQPSLQSLLNNHLEALSICAVRI